MRSGDLDLAVVAAADALPAVLDEPGLKAVAGFLNYAGAGGSYGGDVLLARPGMVANEPATVIAFLSAYIRALQDLAVPNTAADALAAIQATDPSVSPEVAAAWSDAVAPFAPFDGGFGDIDDEGGLGELATSLADGADEEPELEILIAQHTLNIAQAWRDLPANPHSDLRGAPGVTDISIGLPFAEGASSPILVADAAGYFEAAGFESVEIIDIEQPLPGVMTAQIDFGVVAVVDVGDGLAQGLPLQAIAGPANYSGAGGAYGSDVVVASADLIDAETSTVTAFLIAYIQGLSDLAGRADTAPFAPFDGGFGDRRQEGGLGEMRSYLAASLGSEVDTDTMVASAPLEFAQAWWGLPSNPTDAPREEAA